MRRGLDSRPSTDSDAIEEQAARWFVRRDGAAWTDGDELQFTAWLAERSAHRIAYLRLDAGWSQAARLQALGAGVPSGVIPSRGSWGDARFLRARANPEDREVDASRLERRRPGGVRLWSAAVAASVLVLLVAALIPNTRRVLDDHRYVTPVGGIDSIRLADGTQVTLNTDTSLRVILTATQRRIVLERGEAFFDVAKDSARPFSVSVGEKRVVALGTQFAVRRDDSDVRVVVTEGRVSLAEAQSFRVPPPTYLNAGDIARTSKSEVLVRTAAAAEAAKLLSWRRKYVVFSNDALADVVAEFNRYNTRKIYIEDPTIAALRVGGNFKSTNTDGFLWLLQSGFPITVEQYDDKVVLKGR